MKKVRLIVVALALAVVLPGVAGCDEQPSEEPNFNIIFKYGPSAKNILNTFNGTYTKNMHNDPSITTELALTKEESDNIYQKMMGIDFFDYPDEFSVSEKLYDSENSTIVAFVCIEYYFYVEYYSQVKELSWNDRIPLPDFLPSPDNIPNSDNIMVRPIPDPEAIERQKEVGRLIRENNLYWLKTNEQAHKLRELIKLIRDIVESKDEYQELPDPSLVYL